jgi:hypothetical protein
MYFVKGIQAMLSQGQQGRVPDENFNKLYRNVEAGARF